MGRDGYRERVPLGVARDYTGVRSRTRRLLLVDEALTVMALLVSNL